jgi:hypothetical protein
MVELAETLYRRSDGGSRTPTSAWWIGDWLNYGERRYGEKYAQGTDSEGASADEPPGGLTKVTVPIRVPHGAKRAHKRRG